MSSKKVIIDFSPEILKQLERRAIISNLSVSEVISRGISLMKWMDEVRTQGNRILIEKPNGRIYEVLDK